MKENFLYSGSIVIPQGEVVKDKILLELEKKELKPLGAIIISYPQSQPFPYADIYKYTALVVKIEKEEK